MIKKDKEKDAEKKNFPVYAVLAILVSLLSIVNYIIWIIKKTCEKNDDENDDEPKTKSPDETTTKSPDEEDEEQLQEKGNEENFYEKPNFWIILILILCFFLIIYLVFLLRKKEKKKKSIVRGTKSILEKDFRDLIEDFGKLKKNQNTENFNSVFDKSTKYLEKQKKNNEVQTNDLNKLTYIKVRLKRTKDKLKEKETQGIDPTRKTVAKYGELIEKIKNFINDETRKLGENSRKNVKLSEKQINNLFKSGTKDLERAIKALEKKK